MRIAIPVSDGVLSPHFGHAESFVFLDVDPSTSAIRNTVAVPAPLHQPGLLPEWLKDHGAEVVLVGGIGPRAVQLLEARAIRVVTGVPGLAPARLAEEFLRGRLTVGADPCDHGHHGEGCSH
jgi:predicted Fe-Mo cluster-binding NifX family protein